MSRDLSSEAGRAAVPAVRAARRILGSFEHPATRALDLLERSEALREWIETTPSLVEFSPFETALPVMDGATAEAPQKATAGGERGEPGKTAGQRPAKQRSAKHTADHRTAADERAGPREEKPAGRAALSDQGSGEGSTGRDGPTSEARRTGAAREAPAPRRPVPGGDVVLPAADGRGDAGGSRILEPTVPEIPEPVLPLGGTSRRDRGSSRKTLPRSGTVRRPGGTPSDIVSSGATSLSEAPSTPEPSTAAASPSPTVGDATPPRPRADLPVLERIGTLADRILKAPGPLQRRGARSAPEDTPHRPAPQSAGPAPPVLAPRDRDLPSHTWPEGGFRDRGSEAPPDPRKTDMERIDRERVHRERVHSKNAEPAESAQPDPEEAERLASLVNDALVDQARRQGVDVS